MSTKRKRYSAADKAKIALAAIKGEMTVAEIGSKYIVHPTQVNKWKKEALKHMPEAFASKKKELAEDYEEQLAKLYEQIGRLKVENDFLKKKD